MGRPETGRTGARFGAPARRAREEAEPDPAPVEMPVEEDAIGLTGARFGGRSRRPRRQRSSDAVVDESTAVPETPDPDDARPTVELPRITGDERVVAIAPRPYVITGGRTKVRAELRLETMVSALGPAAGEAGERHTVLTVCARPRSVSEVAALTGVPLGVARVLIDDLATEGRVRVHLGVDAASGPDMELLDRVLSGLRRL